MVGFMDRKTFVLLWDGSENGYPAKDRARDRQLTAQGRKAPTRWSFGQGHGDPHIGDRVFLHRTGKRNGIIASGWILADGVEWATHWSDSNALAPYIQVEWDVLVHTDDRLVYEAMKHGMPEFRFPILNSGRAVHSPSDHDLEIAWEKHLAGGERAG
ncbi:conserved hypothetical protein [Rhodococcus sp. RD6.2]|nr:conserved hypothetical protein [Rhodococcus sp. RD6.2]